VRHQTLTELELAHRVWHHYRALSFPIVLVNAHEIGFETVHWNRLGRVEEDNVLLLEADHQTPLAITITANRKILENLHLLLDYQVWGETGSLDLASEEVDRDC
jgi:hypothetical protein